MSVFYRPDDSIVGDVIPFYWNGHYHLFYLKPDPDGVPWGHLVTQDFARFEDWGVAIPTGHPESQEHDIFTGCVMEKDSSFHAFYIGHNGDYPKEGKPSQVIMHAVSPDLRTWTKDSHFDNLLPPTDRGYELSAWRDPCVFWNEQAGEYWMLVTARKASEAPVKRRGCIALLASRDLLRWDLREPLWNPEEYDTHECPDIFRLGEWWYLVYSTYTGCWATHYRMSRSLSGPWLAPPDDLFDGPGFYAAKTAGDDTTRYICGWLATKVGECDAGTWGWGGNLVAHEIVQRPDGTLGVRMPDAVGSQFGAVQELTPISKVGPWRQEGGTFTAKAADRFSALDIGPMPDPCLIEATLTFEAQTMRCGLLLRADESWERYYQLLLEPARQRIVLFLDGVKPVERAFLLERPLSLLPGRPIRLRVISNGTAIVAYADNHVAFSSRAYDLQGGSVGLCVTEGSARFTDVFLMARR